MIMMILVTLKKENVAGIECHENPKTRALWEFKVAK